MVGPCVWHNNYLQVQIRTKGLGRRVTVKSEKQAIKPQTRKHYVCSFQVLSPSLSASVTTCWYSFDAVRTWSEDQVTIWLTNNLGVQHDAAGHFVARAHWFVVIILQSAILSLCGLCRNGVCLSQLRDSSATTRRAHLEELQPGPRNGLAIASALDCWDQGNPSTIAEYWTLPQ